jgi:acyl-CoA reductase-like NAD-dependent aldehyde dehydrogenase
MTASRPEDLDAAVEAVRSAKARWSALGLADRIDLLRRARDSTLARAEDQVRASCQAKGLAFDAPVSAEEWFSGPIPVLRNIRLLIDTLASIARTGAPPIAPGSVRHRPDGRVVVEVFPATRIEAVLYPGTRAEVWLDPEVRLKPDATGTARAFSGAVRLRPDQPGKVALVLAAGNVASIGPMDVLHKLFVENQVCVVKMHPVNEYLGPFLERSFAPFIEFGCLRIVYGGAGEGARLAQHPDVEAIHITGSAATHDAIVWGATPAEQAENKRLASPKLRKHVTSELGCVTPVISVPGEWSAREIDYQAQHVATMIAMNASYNCNAAKMLVTWRSWPQRETFLGRLEAVLASLPARHAYYPGSADKYKAFLAAHPQARRLAEATPGAIPWTTIFGVDPDRADDIAFATEAWCPIIAETALAAGDEGRFLDEAVRFCNERIWGTLSCTLLIDAAARQRLGDRFERAIENLRYGTVAVNQWSALGFVLGATPWGAAPGHVVEDVGSGIGMVHNPLMLERPQKSVIRGRFTQLVRPPWFVTHRSGHRVARRMTAFEARPSWVRLLPIVWHALRA